MTTGASDSVDSATPKSRATSDWLPTACILCECNCGIEVQLGGEDGRRLVRFRGDKRHPASQGYACEKPHRLDYYQNDPNRLTRPLRRRADGSFEEIDWDTAIGEVAEKLAAIRDTHGGKRILYYGGGGQGNHLPGAYAVSTRRALGSRYRGNALAQEKTGEFWVSHRMLGTYTRADFEHCDVALFLGKNPWFSHGIPRARVVLKEIARDPARTMIVVDPRRTKTAELADIHLQVKPGRDAWLLAAMAAIIFSEGLVDDEFIARRTAGLDAIRSVLGDVDVPGYCAIAGVDEELVRTAARAIGNAQAFSSFEDLGVQMNQHSTLVSYLHRLLWVPTGNFGKPGTHFVPNPLVSIADGRHKRDTPVTGQRIIGGLVPCNAIADEILTDHPDRFRAMFVEAANPAHSLADSQRMREALDALELVVVIDVAMTETARHADYVLPCSTQFEKAEATFFNFEFPHNVFQLRPRLLDPPAGLLSEAEIHARLVEQLGFVDDELMSELSTAAEEGLSAYAMAFMSKVAMNPKHMGFAPTILYRTLGPVLPADKREGAVLLGLAMRVAMSASDSLARAGFEGSPLEAAVQLFEAFLDQSSGVVFSVDEWSEVMARLQCPDGRIQFDLPDLIAAARGLESGPAPAQRDFPFTLSAGERRAFTANTIIRDPNWRRKDPQGALRMSPEDATNLGVEDGGRVRLTTRRGQLEVSVSVSDTMQPGHVSLPNGTGLGGANGLGGVAPNELTASHDCDPFVGTPWHKAVPARIERVA